MTACLVLLLTTACRTTFDIAPGAAPFIAEGHLYTTDGERHDAPPEIRGVVHARGDGRLGTYRLAGRSSHVAVLVAPRDIEEAKDRGVDFDPIRFGGASVVASEGSCLEIDAYKRGWVLVPKAAIDRVAVEGQSNNTAIIVIVSVLGGVGLVVGGVVLVGAAMGGVSYR